MKVHTVHEAKTNLSKLIEKACNGEEVIIARGKKPVVKLVPIAGAKKERVPGRFEGEFSWTEDAFDPLTPEEMRLLGFEFE
jgi:prevent-host-death family protein